MIPERLRDAPPNVLTVADALAESITNGTYDALAEQYREFDSRDGAWRDLWIGVLEWAAAKASELES